MVIDVKENGCRRQLILWMEQKNFSWMKDMVEKFSRGRTWLWTILQARYNCKEVHAVFTVPTACCM